MIDVSKIQEKIYSAIQKAEIPGAVWTFGDQHNSSIYSAGYASLIPDQKVMTVDALFDIASLTKVIGTTTLCLQALSNHHISLDDPLQKYLSGYCDHQVTIRQLLTHTSDIQGYIPNRNQLDKDALIKEYLSLYSGVSRGYVKKYTDTGFILLGLMLSEIYGCAVQHMIQDRVLPAFHMHTATFHPDPKNTVSTEYLSDKNEVLCGTVHDPKARILQEDCGSAGLFAGIEDCIAFTKSLFQLFEGIGNDRIQIKQELVQSLLQDQTGICQLKRSLGWDYLYTRTYQYPLLYHTGYTGTWMILDLVKKTYFIFLSNRIHPKDQRSSYIIWRDQVIQTYLKELEGRGIHS